MSNWHHAPAHHLSYGDTFFITGGTFLKQPFYAAPIARDELQRILFAHAAAQTCWLQAWVLLTNHYHLVVRAAGGRVRRMLTDFHSEAARTLNQREGVRNRRVWYQFWDKTLTFKGSWLARLRYTNENAVHHGIVTDARRYRWCSAASFEETAPRTFVEAVSKVRIDSVKVYDAF
jgi:REP element-mobilizing transposase RayT